MKFFGEEGIGTGPTHEFLTLLCKEVQRRSLHLWNESTETPYPAKSVVRMLNYPARGPDTALLEPCEDELNGAFLRCWKCACLMCFTCPEHHCLLSVDRVSGE